MHLMVKRTDNIETYPSCILWHHFQLYAFEHVAGEFSTLIQSLYYLIQDGTFSYTVAAAKDIHFPVKIPHNMFLATPQSVNLYSFDVVSVFLHYFFILYRRKLIAGT